MARPGQLEDALWDIAGAPDSPDLILLTGSAGSGKTAVIGHLMERDHATGGGRFGEALADATHSDSPDEDQAQRLADFFAPFADDQERAARPARLIAINTGMVMKLFSDLNRDRPDHRLHGLEGLLKERLGLPGPRRATPPPTWLGDAVLVVNLDLRPTAGEDGDLFDEILLRLDPSDPGGVLEGTPRCATCQVTDWCWPMANAQRISTGTGRQALNAAAGLVAMRRGRELAPRSLWDLAAELALSNYEVIPNEDPCSPIAHVASAQDDHARQALLEGLACNAALENATPGTLMDEISATEPTYSPAHATHELLSTAGLTPGDDARKLLRWLSTSDQPHAAVQNAAHIVAKNLAPQFPRALTRAAWLGGELHVANEIDPTFDQALQAQADGSTADSADEGGQALLRFLEAVSEGLAAGFGIKSGVETFYPTEAPGPRSTDVLVSTDLLDGGKLWTSKDGDEARHRNPAGALLVRYRQLAVALEVRLKPEGEHEVPMTFSVDFPLWELLQQARHGTAPSTVDLDRYLALRRAMEAIGREAGKNRKLPLLVLQRASGRRFRVAPYGPTSLRATEVE